MIELASIHAQVKPDLAALDKAIRDNLSSDIPFIDQLCHYIIDAGGKRLRPLVAILAARALDYEGSHHINVACAIEFFHTATLLHDDVVDASHLRRGQQTANDIWGSKASILVGDFLFTRAMQILVRCDNPAILALMSDTSNTISKGEIMQLLNCKNPDIGIEDYMAVTYSKTAVLFATAVEAVALLNQAPEQMALRQYGEHLGNAFQIVDDALDYCAETQLLGKNIGDDLAEGKTTLPLIIAMRDGDAKDKAFIQETIRHGEITKLDQLMTIIKKTNAIEQTFENARQQSQLAIQALDTLKDSSFKTALADVATFATQRQF